MTMVMPLPSLMMRDADWFTKCPGPETQSDGPEYEGPAGYGGPRWATIGPYYYAPKYSYHADE